MKKSTDRIRNFPNNSISAKGFTLVELLVVITIIAVLVTVTMSITQKIKAKAYQVNALSSIRQIGTFAVGYATENSGDINTMRWVGDTKEGGGGAWISNSFWGRFQSFLFADSPPKDQTQLKKQLNQRLDRLLNTSDADTMANTPFSKAQIYHDGSGLPVPLGFNKNLYQYNKFLKISSFSDPAQVLYATYGFGFFDENSGKKYVPMPVKGSNSNIYYLDDRKILATFLDGHVETLTAPIAEKKFK